MLQAIFFPIIFYFVQQPAVIHYTGTRERYFKIYKTQETQF